MRVALKHGVLVLVPETPDEGATLQAWRTAHADGVLRLSRAPGDALVLAHLGSHDTVTRLPINVTSRHPDPDVRWIGNFAPTPFACDGRRYASAEGFWQALRYADPEEAERVGRLHGPAAKAAGAQRPYGPVVWYQEQPVPTGTADHWDLMRRAIEAKFATDRRARQALVATGERPLGHRVRQESRTIPGVIVAQMWTQLRRAIQCDQLPVRELSAEHTTAAAALVSELEAGAARRAADPAAATPVTEGAPDAGSQAAGSPALFSAGKPTGGRRGSSRG